MYVLWAQVNEISEKKKKFTFEAWGSAANHT